MAVIGVFHPTKDGGWVGTIRTLVIDAKVRFVPNDNKGKENAPAFLVVAGRSEVGAAWRKQATDGRAFLSVQLVDPVLPAPITAAFFEADAGRSGQLVWRNKS